jgi:photosystem II CP43 chlorophyll apoprotein
LTVAYSYRSKLAERSLISSRYSWWAGNSRFINSSGKFLGAHVSHAGLIMLWAGGMTLFELSHLLVERPFYEQGFIVLPHLSSLGISVGSSCEAEDLYAIFVVGVLHIISSGILVIGGLYHSIISSVTTGRYRCRSNVFIQLGR